MSVPEEPILTQTELPPVDANMPVEPTNFVIVPNSDGTTVVVPEPTIDDVVDYMYPSGGPSPTSQEDLADQLAGIPFDERIVDNNDLITIVDDPDEITIMTMAAPSVPTNASATVNAKVEAAVAAQEDQTKLFLIIIAVVFIVLWLMNRGSQQSNHSIAYSDNELSQSPITQEV